MFTSLHLSHVMCHMSRARVTCHLSGDTCHILFIFFFGQSGGISRQRLCYQRGLPCLVYYSIYILIKVFWKNCLVYNLLYPCDVHFITVQFSAANLVYTLLYHDIGEVLFGGKEHKIFCTFLFCTLMYYTLPHSSLPYCSVFHCTALHPTELYV